MYVSLIVVGLLIAFGSFAFAAFNMARHAKSVLSAFDAPKSRRGHDPEESLLSGLGAMFVKHMGAMVAMVFGGLLAMVGAVLAFLSFLNLL